MHCCLYPQNDHGIGLPPHNIEDMLLTFAVAVREGQFGLGRQIKAQSVEAALRAISQKYVLGGYSNPRRTFPAAVGQSALPTLWGLGRTSTERKNGVCF